MPIDSSKFSSNSLTGTVKVTNGFANISIPTVFYALEGNISFNVAVRTDSVSGAVIYSSPTITLRDPSSFVSLTANTAIVNEGDLVAFTLVTANAAGNSTLYYSTVGGPSGGSFNSANITASDFVANTGSFSLINNIGTFAVKANADLSLMGEYGENFKVQFRTGSTTGNIVYTTSSIDIKDTSNAYNVLSFVENSASAIIEGSNVTFTLTAVNIVDSYPGVILYYNTTGNVTSFTSNTGSFVMTGGNYAGISNTFVITNPQVPFGATRSFNVVVRRDSASGPIIATSNTINVFDASLVSMSASGGVQSNISGYRVHTFTTSGGITFSKSGDVEYLIVAGGGGGASAAAGGGGGGLLLSGLNGATSFTATGGTPYSIVIGAGGSTSTQGTPSTGFGLTAYGGGGGGPGPSGVGTNGGSGGGGAYGGAGKGVYPGSPYISSPRQGYDGGPSYPGGGNGGGGGAGGAGAFADFNTGGGDGLNLSFTGSPYTYSAGGPGTPPMSSFSSGSPPSVFTNTGTYGAGGTGAYSNPGGGFSGPGFVAVRYSIAGPTFANITTPANFVYEGSNVVFTLSTTNVANNTLLYYYTVGNVLSSNFVTGNTGSFTTTQNSTIITLQSNTNIPVNEERFFQLRIAGDAGTSQDPLITSNVFTVKDSNLQPKATSVEYMVIGGGGGGGGRTDPNSGGGGGGAGGLAYGNVNVNSQPITVVVGTGGAAFLNTGGYPAYGNPGSNSYITSPGISGEIKGLGGGGGGFYNNGGDPGGSGGGGAGSPYSAGLYGAAIPFTVTGGTHYGNPGGTGPGSWGSGGGGGGAGGAGTSGGGGSAGGIGRTTNITGAATTWAAGGSGNSGHLIGAPNTGNGGDCATGPVPASPGIPGGGPGIVVIRYPDTLATATTTGSPNVIYANANIIYRFWQSGTMTF